MDQNDPENQEGFILIFNTGYGIHKSQGHPVGPRKDQVVLQEGGAHNILQRESACVKNLEQFSR